MEKGRYILSKDRIEIFRIKMALSEMNIRISECLVPDLPKKVCELVYAEIVAINNNNDQIILDIKSLRHLLYLINCNWIKLNTDFEDVIRLRLERLLLIIPNEAIEAESRSNSLTYRIEGSDIVFKRSEQNERMGENTLYREQKLALLEQNYADIGNFGIRGESNTK